MTDVENETRVYKASECVRFRKTNEEFGKLSNMAPGFPLKIRDVSIRSSEALYQACRFPHMPDVQEMIFGVSSPMTAKMKTKPFRSQSRSDWERVRIAVMKWCLRVKLAQNYEKFSLALEETGDKAIVEESRKDSFWGAKLKADATLIGTNAMGRLLMELRETVRSSSSQDLFIVQPIPIRNFKLLGEVIGVVDYGNGFNSYIPKCQSSGSLIKK